MNTTNAQIVPLIKQTGMRDYEFILEDLELAFPKSQLEEITELWNEGKSFELIVQKYKRHEDEVFLALFHQHRQGKINRPFAFRKKGAIS